MTGPNCGFNEIFQFKISFLLKKKVSYETKNVWFNQDYDFCPSVF